MPTYKLTLQYDGTDFVGWQKQEPPRSGAVPPAHCRTMKLAAEAGLTASNEGHIALRSVQGVLERAVGEAAGQPVVIGGASRTDSGVHARGYVAVVRSRRAAEGERDEDRGIAWPIERGTEPLRRAINARLPVDVYVQSVDLVDPRFNPIADCTSKAYSYTLHTSIDRPLWRRQYVHHVWQELNADRMHEAAQRLVGEHDFTSFAAMGHGRKTTVRTIFSCDVTRLDDTTVRIDVSGNGFLWNMVRIIAGTLVAVGRDKVKPDDIPQIIKGRDRRLAGPTLPSSGLCLEWIRYD